MPWSIRACGAVMVDASARSPLQIALARFQRIPGARFGVWILFTFVLIGIYAPFFTSDVAIFWHDEHGFRVPMFADLFNRRSYPLRHDLLFNVLIFLAPLIGAAWWLLRRRWSARRRFFTTLALVGGLWILCQIPLFPLHGEMRSIWNDRESSSATYAQYHAALDSGNSVSALFPLIPHRFDRPYEGAILREPGTVNKATGRSFLLGTDQVGYDALARMLFGARISLTIGLVSTGLAMLIGLIIGAVSGYFGGWVDLVLQRLVEIMLCFPTFILVLTVIAMTDRNIFIIMVVLGLTGWAGTARLVRGEFLSQSVRDYVTACEALGLPRWRIMFRHILPNSLSPLLISATFSVAGSIFTESGLSFLGLGDPNAPSWGMLLNHGRQNITSTWLIYAPGFAVFSLLTALNLVGNGLREALDPKSTA
jgi:peptide/nickel transport system permease protein